MAEQDDYWLPAYELMLEEARRSIDRQSERLQSVRERSVGLVGFGAVVAAAFGLAGGEDLGLLGWVGVVAFTVVAGAALFVLFPREFKFEMSARRIDGWFYDRDQDGVGHMIHSAAIRHDEHHEFNHDKLKGMQNAVAVGVGALAVQTVALLGRLVI